MASNRGGNQAKPGSIDDKVVDATLNSYYPSILASADSARSRSQVAYTIASATAAALVAAGAFSHIQQYDTWVRALGGLALAAWLVAAALFMRVSKGVTVHQTGDTSLSRSDGTVEDGVRVTDADKFVMRALEIAHQTGDEIDKRLTYAVRIVYVALIVTALAFGVALAFPPKTTRDVSIDLTFTGETLVADICGKSSPPLTGKLEADTLGKALTAIDLPVKECTKRDQENVKEITLLIPASDIRDITENDGKTPFYP